MLMYIYLIIGVIFGVFGFEFTLRGIIEFFLWACLWPIMLIGTIVVMYIGYKLIISSARVLRSAGKMKTGNDLAEQYEDTVKNEKVPNVFQFYYRLHKKQKEAECE